MAEKGERLQQIRANANARFQDGVKSLQSGARTSGEWLRRRSIDIVNATLGLAVIGLGYEAITLIVNNPHLANIPSELATLWPQVQHLPLRHVGQALQESGNIIQQGYTMSSKEIVAAGDDSVKTELFLGGDVAAALVRHTFVNVPERIRRYGPTGR